MPVDSSATPRVTTRAFSGHAPFAFVRAAHHPRLSRRTALRPGSIIKSLLTTMCGGALLLAAAAVLDPATLQANSHLPQATPASHDAERTALARDLEALLTNAKHTLLIRPPNDDRGCEVMLWLNDTHQPGVLNLEELALLRHSPLFQTLTLYTVATTSQQSTHHDQEASSPDALTTEAIAAPGFIDRWRTMASVRAKVIATRISDVRIETITRHAPQPSSQAAAGNQPPTSARRQLSHLGEGHPAGTRLTLTYARDSVDGDQQPDITVFAVSLQESTP